MKITLNAAEVELAYDTAKKRFIGNIRMNKGFSYNYNKGLKGQLTDSFLGALGEVAFAKATNRFFNGSYSDNFETYLDSDFQDHIEVRTQENKSYNFLLIRPNEKKGKYVLVIKDNDKDFSFTIKGWFLFDRDMDERLTNFGHYDRPAAYKVELNELNNIDELIK